MKKTFSGRRVARKIGTHDDEGDTSSVCAEVAASTLKRPTFTSKRHSQARRFGSGTDDDDDTTDTGVRTPKKSGLSRIAIQRNAGQRSSFLANSLPHADEESDSARPTYSSADLQALRDSTPVTPAKFETTSEPDGLALQLSDKFGSSLARYGQSSAIPSATEIAEKKARRARLALEQKADEYISLDPDDPGWEEDDDGNVVKDMDGRLVLREKDRYGIQESRLVRDDEDVMEGFDEYTGDPGPRIAMGNSAKPVDQQTRRNEIARQIAQAQSDSDASDSDPEEKRRNAAFEAAQTRHGAFNTDHSAKIDKYAAYRVKTPPVITPIPTLEDVIKRFRASILELETRKREKEAEMLQLSQAKLKLKDEEERVQRQLKEVAEKFRQIKIEKGFLPKDEALTATATGDSTEDTSNGVSIANDAQHAAQEIVDEEQEAEQHVGIGLGARSTGLGFTSLDGTEESDRQRLGLGLGAAGLGWQPARDSEQ